MSAHNFLENRMRHAYPTWRSFSSGELCLFTCKYKHLCIAFREFCRCGDFKELQTSRFRDIMRRRWSKWASELRTSVAYWVFSSHGRPLRSILLFIQCHVVRFFEPLLVRSIKKTENFHGLSWMIQTPVNKPLMDQNALKFHEVGAEYLKMVPFCT